MKKTIKTTVTILILALILPLLGACWDLRELNNLAIVTGVGIDAAEDGKINLIVQMGATSNATSTASDSKAKKPFLISEIETDSIAEGLFNLRSRNSRFPFMHHTQVLIVGREQAEIGIKNHLDVFLREHEMRLEVWMIVAHEDAKKILMTEISPEKQSSIAIAMMIERSSILSKEIPVSLLNFISMLENENSASFAPILSVEKEDDEDKLIYKGLAIFKDGKMVGEINFDMTKGFAWTSKKLTSRILKVNTELGSCVFEVFQVKNKLLVNEQPDKSLKAEVEVKGNMEINEITGFDNMTLDEITQFLEEQSNLTIENEIRETYQKMQELKADIYKFSDYLYRKKPKLWKTVNDDWDEKFEQMELSCKVEMTIKDSGKTNEALKMRERGAK